MNAPLAQPRPALRGDPHDGPDLNDAMPLDQMLNLLGAAMHEGPEVYVPLWQRLLSGVGGYAGFMWQDVFPILMVGSTEDAQAGERRQLADELTQHMRQSGFRQQLVEQLVGDTAGTNPNKDAEEVARATLTAVRDFLATEGRILIDPQGDLTENGGMPRSWGKSEERDEEIMRAGRVYFSPLACPRPRAQIRAFVETFGQRTINGWLELASDAPIFNDPEVVFAAWRAAIERINSSNLTNDDPEDWAISEYAESFIVEGGATGPRVAEMRLWIALLHSLQDRKLCQAASSCDLTTIIDAVGQQIGWPEWPMIRALEALRAEVAA
jgi:hypothetical protein